MGFEVVQGYNMQLPHNETSSSCAQNKPLPASLRCPSASDRSYCDCRFVKVSPTFFIVIPRFGKKNGLDAPQWKNGSPFLLVTQKNNTHTRYPGYKRIKPAKWRVYKRSFQWSQVFFLQLRRCLTDLLWCSETPHTALLMWGCSSASLKSNCSHWGPPCAAAHSWIGRWRHLPTFAFLKCCGWSTNRKARSSGH